MPSINISKLAALTGHTGAVYTLAADPEYPEIFYSAGGDGKVIRWNLDDTGNAELVANTPGKSFSLLKFPGERMAVGQMDGTIYILDPELPQKVKTLSHHGQGVFDLCFKQSILLGAGGDGYLSFWNEKDFLLLNSIEISTQSLRQINCHPLENILAIGSSDNNVYILESGKFSIIKTLSGHENSVFSVCFSPDGKYLLTGSRDAHLKVWNTQNQFALVKSIPAHMFTINSIVYSPDGKYFATASRDKTIKIWNAQNFELLKVIDKEKFDGHVNSVNKLLWSSHGNLLISASDDRSIMVWEIKSQADRHCDPDSIA